LRDDDDDEISGRSISALSIQCSDAHALNADARLTNFWLKAERCSPTPTTPARRPRFAKRIDRIELNRNCNEKSDPNENITRWGKLRQLDHFLSSLSCDLCAARPIAAQVPRAKCPRSCSKSLDASASRDPLFAESQVRPRLTVRKRNADHAGRGAAEAALVGNRHVVGSSR